jgi:hypothetical protein
MNVFEVNGITYTEKPVKKSSYPGGYSKILTTMLAFGFLSGGYPFSQKSSSQKTPETDIVKEYGLIQQKKSSLTRREREYVVYQFEKTFQKVEFGTCACGEKYIIGLSPKDSHGNEICEDCFYKIITEKIKK